MIGIYLRGLTHKHNIIEIAQRCSDHGVTMIAIMSIWQESEEDKKVNSKYMADCISVFSEYGIEPWIWGYPWCGKENVFIDRIRWIKVQNTGLRGIILDPELGYQGHRVGRETAKAGAKKLVSGVLNVMNESMDLGVTSFGCAHVHKTFPWEQFCAGFGSPQFYKIVKCISIRRGLERWKKAGWTELRPSIPTFGPNSGVNLPRYIDSIRRQAAAVDLPITGWLLWSYRQLDSMDWKVIDGLSR